MPKPTSSFSFEVLTPLQVKFEDNSSNVPTTWAWDFGDGNSSVLQNPIHTFLTPGIYTVSLTSSNAAGSDVFELDLVVENEPSLNLTIAQLIEAEIPIGIELDKIYMGQLIKKWQLYLQTFITNPEITNTDVFNELVWPPLCNVLIAKLVIRDLILRAAQAAMIAFSNASGTFNSNIAGTSQSTASVSDYTAIFDTSNFNIANTTLSISIVINNDTIGPVIVNSVSALLTWLNSLGKGSFIYGAGELKSLGNTNNVLKLTFTWAPGGIESPEEEIDFNPTNERVVPLYTTSTSQKTNSGVKGSLKSLETGPSKVEWYDGSEFWSTMFKGNSSLANPGQGTGILQTIQDDSCILARRLAIRLPFCAKIKSTHLFIVGRKTCKP